MIYGEGGSGKTNVCLQITKTVTMSGKKVAYMDTEGVSTERLSQMAGKNVNKVLNNILFFKPFSFEEQEEKTDEMIRVVEASKEVELIIVDSATMYFRLNYSEKDDARSSLTYQMIRLLTLARKKEIPVLITSQVYVDVEKDEIRPLGGSALFHNAKTIIFLQKSGPHRRRAVIIKHRALEEGKSISFRIADEGLVPVDDKPKS
jgi:DNA repair protein RadB